MIPTKGFGSSNFKLLVKKAGKRFYSYNALVPTNYASESCINGGRSSSLQPIAPVSIRLSCRRRRAALAAGNLNGLPQLGSAIHHHDSSEAAGGRHTVTAAQAAQLQLK